MAQLLLASFFLFLHILGVDSDDGEFCYEYSYSLSQTTYYAYCDSGCCGYTYDRECCDEDDSGWVGIIIGCVIAGLIGTALIVSCLVCLVCVSISKRGSTGRVIAPCPQQQGTTNVAVISTPTNWAYTSTYRSQPQSTGYPMGYSQYGGTTGSFPQPPPYEHNPVPSTAPPEYPSPRALYEPPSTSAQRLPPINGASTQHFSPRLPLIGHGKADTPKA